MKTFVLNGKEVVLTGRVAKPKPRRSGREVDESRYQYEVRPVGVDVKNTDFNEWARMSDLLEVVNDE